MDESTLADLRLELLRIVEVLDRRPDQVLRALRTLRHDNLEEPDLVFLPRHMREETIRHLASDLSLAPWELSMISGALQIYEHRNAEAVR